MKWNVMVWAKENNRQIKYFHKKENNTQTRFSILTQTKHPQRFLPPATAYKPVKFKKHHKWITNEWAIFFLSLLTLKYSTHTFAYTIHSPSRWSVRLEYAQHRRRPRPWRCLWCGLVRFLETTITKTKWARVARWLVGAINQNLTYFSCSFVFFVCFSFVVDSPFLLFCS